MPAISPRDLVNAILSACQDSGCSGALTSGLRQHPRKFVIQTSESSFISVWVYAWTLTHGGRRSLPYEYRIQMTTVASPLVFNPSGDTVLIGYEPNLKMFAGFDIERHRNFTTGSPSVQVDIRTLRRAIADGMAFDRKNNDEIAVGFRPDQLVNYCVDALKIHKLGTQGRTFALLEKASALDAITDAELNALSTEKRKRMIQRVSKLARDANFRRQIMVAYENRCAITGVQLKLVDAAHVLPVGAPGSVDNVVNGIALSPTYHRAYDNGLIYFTEQYEMRLNRPKVSELADLGLDGGLIDFRSSLGRLILPPDRRQWPKPEFIRKANRFRQISA